LILWESVYCCYYKLQARTNRFDGSIVIIVESFELLPWSFVVGS
jgi:hypothetical protein